MDAAIKDSVISSAKGDTLFDVLGLDIGNNVSLVDLERRFLDKQREFHPDNYSDHFERAVASKMSALVNEAYHTLRDPVRRCEYLMQISGGAHNCVPSSTMSVQLAMHVFEQRERFERMNEYEKDAFIAQIEQEQRVLSQRLAIEQDLSEMASLLQQIKYNASFLKDVRGDAYSRD